MHVFGCYWMFPLDVWNWRAAFDTVYLSILVRNSQTIQNQTFGAYEVDFITCKTLTETYWGDNVRSMDMHSRLMWMWGKVKVPVCCSGLYICWQNQTQSASTSSINMFESDLRACSLSWWKPLRSRRRLSLPHASDPPPFKWIFQFCPLCLCTRVQIK